MVDVSTLLLPDADDHFTRLDAFVSTCLAEGGVWASWRTSDGILSIDRVLERTPERLRVCGRIYAIEQTLHPFWLEVDANGATSTWMLYFDLATTSQRRMRGAMLSYASAGDIEWRVVLAGEAAVGDDRLVVCADSTRVLALQ